MLNKVQSSILMVGGIFLVGCGNPGDISDEFYNEFKMLAPPKILYSCTTTRTDIEAMLAYTFQCTSELDTDELLGNIDGETSPEEITKQVRAFNEDKCNDTSKYQIKEENVAYSASRSGLFGYNSLLSEAKEKCDSEQGFFKVLEGKS